MALVAVHAVVDIARHSRVIGVRLRRCVAVRALENRVVVRIRVASGANAVGVSVVHWEPRVIERCAEPVRRNPRCMARCAGCREAGRSMIRIRRPVVIGGMAGVAIRRRSRKYAVDVAQITRHCRVWPLQWKRRVVVIERCIEPRRGRVAHGAIRRIGRCDVIRNTSTQRCCAVVIGRMAAIATCGQSARVVVRVAAGARDGRVGARERERGSAMVERRVKPRSRCVAQRAILREVCRDVIRHALHIRRAGVIRRVAAIACGRQGAGVIVGVTRSTGDCGVRTIQWKCRCVVVERCVKPGGSGVALRADLRKSGVNVIWNPGHVRCAGEILSMATVAGSRERTGVIVRMAGGAGDGHMRARQRKRGGVVIKCAGEPRHGGMAHRAVLREICRDVVRHAPDVCSAVVIGGVATVACGRERARIIIGVAR